MFYSYKCEHAGKDREFVCIKGVSCKISKPKTKTNFEKITESAETFVNWVLDNYHCVPENFPCQSLCSNDCGECFKEWLSKECDNG